MSLQSLINSRFGIATILAIGRTMPPAMGYRLADRVAKNIASRKSTLMVRAMRANLWIATGQKLNARELGELTAETFRKTANVLYDFYHTLHDHEAIVRRVILSPKLTNFLKSRLGGKEGTLMVAPHLSNFDLAGRAMALNGFDIQALSYPNPGGGYQWQNELRKGVGIDISPMSVESMRRAKERLKNGGGVITGLERPLADTNYFPNFFGYPAPVPVSYVRMALQTNSALLVVACVGTPQENYRLECSDLIYMQPHKDRQEEIEKNAEKVLSEGEKFIRACPSQWSMAYPLWDFALDEMPL